MTVEETFDNDHRVVSQQASYDQSKSADVWFSKFTFSAADSGLHRICFTATGPASAGAGWFSGGNGGYPGGVRLTLDLAIGETSKIESDDKGKFDDMTKKVKNLNDRLTDIQREQQFQRVSPGLLPVTAMRSGSCPFYLESYMKPMVAFQASLDVSAIH